MLFSRKIYCKLVFAIFASTMLVSCEEWEGLFPNCRFQDKVEAKLLGQDPRDCADCCGGYLIEIADSIYRFVEEPSCSSLNLEESDYEFPLDVWVDWEPDPNGCAEDIILENIKLK
ncbi:MAG: hypothetical protein AAGC85_01330 [Bacteroidota bacterium]